MKTAFQIALKDLKLRVRDRSAIIIGIVAPLALAFIFNAVFGGAFDPTQGLGLEYGVVDLDESDLSRGFLDVLDQVEDEGILSLASYGSASTADRAIEDNDIARELVTLEYEILRFLFLQLIEGDSRESGADVIFKFEF